MTIVNDTKFFEAVEKAIEDKDKGRFNSLLNSSPNDANIIVNELTGSCYIPISVIENELDMMFQGDVNTYDFKWMFKDTSKTKIMASLILEVIHPVTGRVIRRIGAASIPLDKETITGEDEEGKAFTIEMDLELCFPKIIAECTKNAAKKLGKRFGRELNRTIEGDWIPKKIDDLVTGLEPKEYLDFIKEVDAIDSKQKLIDEGPIITMKAAQLISDYTLNRKLNMYIAKKITSWDQE